MPPERRAELLNLATVGVLGVALGLQLQQGLALARARLHARRRAQVRASLDRFMDLICQPPRADVDEPGPEADAD